MTHSFNDLIAAADFDGEALRADIPADWMQGRTTYGGLSAALCLETARRAYPDLPPLRSAMIAFIGPAGGAVEGRARELRRGRSVAFIEADLSAETGLATRGTFAFGAARESMLDATWTPPPDLPGPEDCAPLLPHGMGPNFAAHFETALAKGGRPFSGSDEHDHFIWVRHVDPATTGPVALLALADMPPPAVMPMAREFKPVSSMTWQVNLLSDAPQTREGWWLLQSRAEDARHGYSSQDMLVWNRDLELVIAGRQSVAVFF